MSLEKKQEETHKTGSYTPQPNRKIDITILESQIDSLIKDSKPNVKIFGICGGPSCGKSKIGKYFQTKITNSEIIAEKDYFFQKDNEKRPRKSSFQEEKENIFALSNEDGYSASRKKRLIDLSNPDSYQWDELIVE